MVFLWSIYYDTKVQIFTLGIDDASTNVFVKDNCTAKPIFRKNKVNIRYMRCFDKIRISMLKINSHSGKSTYKTHSIQGPQAVLKFLILKNHKLFTPEAYSGPTQKSKM